MTNPQEKRVLHIRRQNGRKKAIEQIVFWDLCLFGLFIDMRTERHRAIHHGAVCWSDYKIANIEMIVHLPRRPQ